MSPAIDKELLQKTLLKALAARPADTFFNKYWPQKSNSSLRVF